MSSHNSCGIFVEELAIDLLGRRSRMINGSDQNWTRLKRHFSNKLLDLVESLCFMGEVGKLQAMAKFY